MKEVAGYEGLYSVTEDGEIYSHGREMKRSDGRGHKTHPKFLRKQKDGHDYYQVNLRGIVNKTMRVHRIVALAYIPNPDNLPCVNHIDGNIHNNHFTNLEWCTHSHNNQHAYDTGLKSASEWICRRGSDSASFKSHIRGERMGDGLVKIYAGSHELRADGFSPQNVHKVIKGERTHHKGWRFTRIHDHAAKL